MMITQVTNNWWMLQYEDVEGKYAWFATTEAQVKGKFASWMNRKMMRAINIPVSYDLPAEDTAIYNINNRNVGEY